MDALRIINYAASVHACHDKSLKINLVQPYVGSLKNDKISIQNTSIIASINYASRIQNAMLPKDELFTNLFNEHFILYKPRDIVSGDFYWFAKINKYQILAIADCTGHGVPGAFVSMLGISFLNEIVRKKSFTQAKQVLEELRRQIKQSLNQTVNEVGSKDGMDISLCVFDTEANKVQFSGANNPIYLVTNKKSDKFIIKNNDKIVFDKEIIDKDKVRTYENNSNILVELKPERQPIGIYFNETPFTQYDFDFKQDMSIYMLTDGYADQIGSEDNQKFYIKKLKTLLLKNIDYPMQKQKEILEQTFKRWQGNYKQLDDVLVMGIKLMKNG